MRLVPLCWSLPAAALLLVACSSSSTSDPADLATGTTVDMTAPVDAAVVADQAMAAPEDMATRPIDLAGGAFTIACGDFANGTIAKRYAHFFCNGDNVSPALVFGGVPQNARRLALVMDDPDAGGFTHWTAWDLPADAKGIPESGSGTAAAGSEGRNDFGEQGYGGPCPPAKHTYVFTLYALDAALGLSPSTDPKTVRNAIKAHTVAKAELRASYTP